MLSFSSLAGRATDETENDPPLVLVLVLVRVRILGRVRVQVRVRILGRVRVRVRVRVLVFVRVFVRGPGPGLCPRPWSGSSGSSPGGQIILD